MLGVIQRWQRWGASYSREGSIVREKKENLLVLSRITASTHQHPYHHTRYRSDSNGNQAGSRLVMSHVAGSAWGIDASDRSLTGRGILQAVKIRTKRGRRNRSGGLDRRTCAYAIWRRSSFASGGQLDCVIVVIWPLPLLKGRVARLDILFLEAQACIAGQTVFSKETDSAAKRSSSSLRRHRKWPSTKLWKYWQYTYD